MLKTGIWVLTAVFASLAGWTDLKSRRIPNWLTVPGLLVGIAANSWAYGWAGTKSSLLGAGLGLALLFPFVLIKGVGAGDWKLVGALGAFLGPMRLIVVLIGTIFVNAIMAVIMMIWKKRVRQTLRNLAGMVGSLMTFHLPGPEVTLDHPEALKVPFGVAVAITVLGYTAVFGFQKFLH